MLWGPPSNFGCAFMKAKLPARKHSVQWLQAFEGTWAASLCPSPHWRGKQGPRKLPLPWADRQGLPPRAQLACRVGLGKGRGAGDGGDRLKGIAWGGARRVRQGAALLRGIRGHLCSAAWRLSTSHSQAYFKTPMLSSLLLFLSLICQGRRESCGQVQHSERTPSPVGAQPLTAQGAI